MFVVYVSRQTTDRLLRYIEDVDSSASRKVKAPTVHHKSSLSDTLFERGWRKFFINRRWPNSSTHSFPRAALRQAINKRLEKGWTAVERENDGIHPRSRIDLEDGSHRQHPLIARQLAVWKEARKGC